MSGEMSNFTTDLARVVESEEKRDLRELLVRVDALLEYAVFPTDVLQANNELEEVKALVKSTIASIPTLRGLVNEGVLVVGVDHGDPAGDRAVEVYLPIETADEEDEAFEEWLSRVPNKGLGVSIMFEKGRRGEIS